MFLSSHSSEILYHTYARTTRRGNAAERPKERHGPDLLELEERLLADALALVPRFLLLRCNIANDLRLAPCFVEGSQIPLWPVACCFRPKAAIKSVD
jgi:hypothetical protein